MKDVAIHVAKLMAAAARTAPKGGGKDFLEIVVIDSEADLQRIAGKMREYAPQSTNEPYWLRDADNIAGAQALVLIGLAQSRAAGYDCGGCGYPTCKDFEKNRNYQKKDLGYGGPHCVMRMMDIGVALCSAAKTASLLNVDNRIQQRVWAAARALGLIQADAVMGIPVGIYGKNIFFDRKVPGK